MLYQTFPTLFKTNLNLRTTTEHVTASGDAEVEVYSILVTGICEYTLYSIQYMYCISGAETRQTVYRCIHSCRDRLGCCAEIQIILGQCRG